MSAFKNLANHFVQALTFDTPVKDSIVAYLVCLALLEVIVAFILIAIYQ